MAKIMQLFSRLATGRNVLIFLGLFILFNAVIMPWAGGRIQSGSGGVGPLDLQFSYTPDKAYEMIAAYGEARQFYALFDLTGDVVYPLVTLLAFGTLLTFLFKRAFAEQSALHRLALLPVLTLIADYAENVGIVTMLLSYPAQLGLVAQITSVLTTIKWLCVGVTLVLVVVGLGGWIGKKMKQIP